MNGFTLSSYHRHALSISSRTGILVFGSDDIMTDVAKSLEANGVSHETFPAAEVSASG